MGKSKHASFSSLDKSNFQLLKAKFRENGFKKYIERAVETKKHSGNGEKEEKEKKRFWWKWLSFVRGRWSCQGTRSNDKTSEMAMVAQYRGSSMCTERSTGDELPVSGNVSYEIERLKESDTNNSEMSGKSHSKRLTWNAEVFENNTGMPKNSESLLTSALFIRQDMNEIVESAVFIEPNLPKDYADSKKSDEISQKSLRINKRRVSYKMLENEVNDQILKTFKTVSEPTWDKRKKILQQQRLQDNINNLLEQFMFLEAEDIIDFSVSQSQLVESKKRIGFNGSSVSSRQPLIKELSREVSPEILVNIKPFKEYVSDNYLSIKGSSTELVLKNFTCGNKQKQKDTVKKKAVEMLEKSNNIPESEKINEKTIVPVLECDVTFAKVNDSGCAEKSSCEVTGRILSLSAVEKEINNTCYETCLEEVSDLVSVKLEDDFETATPSCTVWGVYRSYSTCKSIVEEDEEENEEKKEENVEKKEEDVEKKEEDEEKKEEDEEKKEENVEKKEEDEEKKENLGEEGPKKLIKNNAEEDKKSLDDVLNNLDDSDHDVIFQKNISQFRKKINSKPRFDIKKSTFQPGKVESKNVKLTKNVAEVVKPVKGSLAKINEMSVQTSIKKEIPASRFDCSKLWKQGRKPKKILENFFLQLSEATLICRMLATRIEARSISFPQTLREVHDILESNNFTELEIEVPISFEKDAGNNQLLRAGSGEILQWPDKPLLDVKKYATIAAVLSFQGRDFDGKFCTIENDLGNLGRHILQSSNIFLNPPESFYLVQNQLLLDYEEKSESNTKTLNVCEKSSSKYLKNLIKMRNDKLEKDEENLINNTRHKKNIIKLLFLVYENDGMFVQILYKPSYEYVAGIYDGAIESTGKSQPEPDLLKNNLNRSDTTHPGFALSELENPTSIKKIVPDSVTGNNLKTQAFNLATYKSSNPDIHFDGFEILYNNSKESLDDDEDTTKTVFARSYPENNSNVIFPVKNKNLDNEKEQDEENKEGGGGEREEKEEEEEEKKKKGSWFTEETDILRSLEKKISGALKYKSNSSPRENIHQTEFCFQEHRMRRSLVLPKETEKDFFSYKKRRLSLDKGIEVRKTGSALLESQAVTLGNERSCVQKKPNLGIEEAVKSLILPYELKTVMGSEHKSLEGKKMFLLEKSGTNIKKEVVAAFNSIKEHSNCKGETKGGHKRMSLVIMLSRK